ncbi:MAG: ATP-dependent RecD-like DNA helicase [Prochlorococcus sp.]
MNHIDASSWPVGLSKALHHTLVNRIPPKVMTPHLEDLVNALMNALAEGDLQIDLSSTSPPSELKSNGWPEAHRQALLDSGWLEGDTAPMVLDGEQLSWSRWHQNINEVIEELLARSILPRRESKIAVINEAKAEADTNTKKVRDKNLNLPENIRLNPEQKEAVRAMDCHGIVLLSGGPGTGKTSTILQMLSRALNNNPEIKIGLAAPTGKAARHLQDALRKNLGTLENKQQQVLEKLQCGTLHRLLQAKPGGFGRHQHNLLNLDLLVVDEMSMVDLALMQALLHALPRNSQLVLVGDPAQLPPIGSGAVWHQLQQAEIRKNFHQGAIHLHRLYRNRGALAALSQTLREQGLGPFWEQLSHIAATENVKHHRCSINGIPKVVVSQLKEHCNKLKNLSLKLMDESPEDLAIAAEPLMDGLEKLMVLCPKRRGFWGVNDVHNALLGRNHLEGVTRWPLGTPVMCGENQPELGLSNGDLGVVIGEGSNRRMLFRVITEEEGLQLALIHPARLRVLEPALALTIHKAQGSEANHVMILWPETSTSNETCPYPHNNNCAYDVRLLYTAMTRSSQHVDLFSAEPKRHFS